MSMLTFSDCGRKLAIRLRKCVVLLNINLSNVLLKLIRVFRTVFLSIIMTIM